MYVILMGNPADGFVVIGPFSNRDDAHKYLLAEDAYENVWIVDLQQPAKETE
jgi:hypothetical protein